MNLQYHFQLVFLKLVLKRNVLSQSNLRITLLETIKELQPGSNAFQTEQIKIRKGQKIIDLESMKMFTFNAKKNNGENKFIIKYQVKGNSQERVRSIPVNVEKMIQEFQTNKKSVFQESFGGQNAEISYKIYITNKQREQVFNLLVTPQNKEGGQESGNDTKRSNSISRGKRPPNLNISKRGTTPSPPPARTQSSQQQLKPMMKHLSSNAQTSLQAMSPLSPEPNKMPYLNLKNMESHEQNSSISGTHQKISSLPLSEIQKVNELMATHHRPQVEEHHASFLSYKLKIVIVMIIIGILFLLVDTFSDRKMKGRETASQDHHNAPHAHHGKKKHQPSHGKASKKPKSKVAPKSEQKQQKASTKKMPPKQAKKENKR